MKRVLNMARVGAAGLTFSMIALTVPQSALAFSTFASTSAFAACTLSSPQGGDMFGDSLLSAIAPPVLPTAGSCGASPYGFSASASAMIGTGPQIITSASPFAFGQLRVMVNTNGPAEANAKARIQDQLTIIPTPDFSDPGFHVTFTLISHGTLSGEAFAGGGLSAGSLIESSNFPTPALCTGTPDLCGGVPHVSPGVETQTIDVTIEVPTLNPIVFFTAELFADSNGLLLFTTPNSILDGSADFSNTASLSVTLPAGFNFVSESGIVTTSQPGSAVPEPSTLALLGAGLAGLGFWRRRKLN